jgi:catechol-2,3-dioxygenase
MAIRKLGHVGIWAKDFERLRDFYSRVLGLTISDETPNVAFMTSDPKREHHEFAVFRATEPGQHTSVQQISFSCERLEDVIDYYKRFKENDVKVARVTSHGNAVGLYFFDPEDNRCEVYWTTPFEARQPYGVAIDINRSAAAILAEIEADVKLHGATGRIDPESYVKQREQFVREGVRH